MPQQVTNGAGHEVLQQSAKEWDASCVGGLPGKMERKLPDRIRSIWKNKQTDQLQKMSIFFPLKVKQHSSRGKASNWDKREGRIVFLPVLVTQKLGDKHQGQLLCEELDLSHLVSLGNQQRYHRLLQKLSLKKKKSASGADLKSRDSRSAWGLWLP